MKPISYAVMCVFFLFLSSVLGAYFVHTGEAGWALFEGASVAFRGRAFVDHLGELSDG